MTNDIQKAEMKGRGEFWRATKNEDLPLPLSTSAVLRECKLTRKQFDYIRARFRTVIDFYLLGNVGRSLLWSPALPFVIKSIRKVMERE